MPTAHEEILAPWLSTSQTRVSYSLVSGWAVGGAVTEGCAGCMATARAQSSDPLVSIYLGLLA